MFTPAIGTENSIKEGELQSLPNRRQKETMGKCELQIRKIWNSVLTFLFNHVPFYLLQPDFCL